MPKATYRIAKGDVSPWVIIGPGGSHVLSGEDFRTDREAVAALRGMFAREGVRMETVETPEGLVANVTYPPGAVQPTLPRSGDRPVVTFQVRASAELARIVHDLAATYDTTPEGAILRAIGLLKVAADARRDGKGLAIVDDELNVDQEITGI